MRKRRAYFILGVVGIVLAGVLVAVFAREREPEYGGKKLSEWMEERAFTDTTNFNNAIFHIGARAIPYLLEWMRYNPSAWKWKIYAYLPIQDKKFLRSRGTRFAFKALPPPADRDAVEALIPLLNDTSPNVVTCAECALIDLRNCCLPALIVGLTNQPPKAGIWLLDLIASLRTNARPALPDLLALTKHPDALMREAVTNALRAIDPQALERANH